MKFIIQNTSTDFKLDFTYSKMSNLIIHQFCLNHFRLYYIIYELLLKEKLIHIAHFLIYSLYKYLRSSYVTILKLHQLELISKLYLPKLIDF